MMQPSDFEQKIVPLSDRHLKKPKENTPASVHPIELARSSASENEKPPTEVPPTVVASTNGIDTPALVTTTNTDMGDGASIHSAKDSEDNSNPPGFIPVLKNSNFLALWSGQVFCQIADKVYLVLMIALIDTLVEGDTKISGWVSALMMTFTIPAVLFGSVAGVYVDRWQKKTVLVATNLLRGILVFLIPLLLFLTHDWAPIAGKLPVGFGIILGVTFLVSTLTQFFAPAEQSTIPLVVQSSDLLSANSLYTTTMMASVIVGFAVGEPLLGIADNIWQQLGGTGGLGKEILVGGSYAVAGLLLMLLKTGEKKPEKELPHVFADLRDGFRYLGENRLLRNALIQLVILFSVFAALTVIAVSMAEAIPNLKASQFGFLLASGGVGIAIGAIVLGQFGQRFSHTRLSLIGSIGMTASLLGLSVFTTQLWASVLLLALVGVFGALIGIPMQTTIQKETPTEMHGKVFGLQNNVINIALTLPLALAGVAETFIGLQGVFLGLATIVISGGVLTCYIFPR